jgi:putative radical SAM enzyme (TIGR03279 family)
MKEFNQVANKLLPAKIDPEKTLTWVVGNAVEKAFAPLVDRLNRVEGLRVNMVALYSDYWGQNITVTGLLTGHDLLYHLKGKDLGDSLLLPSIMLKHGELVFLDDMTVAQVSQELNIRILPVAGVEDLIEDLIRAC